MGERERLRLHGRPRPLDPPAELHGPLQALGGELPAIRLHELRHSHATLALEAGVAPKVVSDRLGHASTSFTMDAYADALPAVEETAAAMVAALVLGEDGG